MLRLSALVYLLFQIVVTPFYAAVMLSTFWPPRVSTYKMAATGAR